jgi:transposase
MPKPRDYHLKKRELEAIVNAIRHDPRPEVRQRCTTIHLLHLGHKVEKIAEMQSVSVPSVYNWIKCWRRGGIEALATKPRSGRPRLADEAYALALEETLGRDPGEFGYGFRIWTVDRLRAHLEKKTGIGLSESSFRQLLKRKGYRYRRPKADLGHLQDKKAKAQARELLEELKKRSSETISSSSLWTKPP